MKRSALILMAQCVNDERCFCPTWTQESKLQTSFRIVRHSGTMTKKEHAAQHVARLAVPNKGYETHLPCSCS